MSRQQSQRPLDQEVVWWGDGKTPAVYGCSGGCTYTGGGAGGGGYFWGIMIGYPTTKPVVSN